ncbi:MAG: hypothetical protein ACYS8W_05225 [Planctomycetota bacterium]|jgi:hypothetical protein
MKHRLAIFAAISVICLFSAYLFAGEVEKPAGEKPEETGKAEEPRAPETPEEEEARIKKTYSKYVVLFIDIEEEIVYHNEDKKEKPKWGLEDSLAYAFRLTNTRSYKGMKHDARRKKWKIADVENPHIWILKEGTTKPKRDKKDKNEPRKKFTAEDAKKYAQYILSGTVTITEREPSKFYGKLVAFGFDGALDLKLERVKDGKVVWEKKDEVDKSATERGGGKSSAIRQIQMEFENKWCPKLVQLPEWEKAKKALEESQKEEEESEKESEKEKEDSEKKPEDKDEK